MVEYPSYVTKITHCDQREIPRTPYHFRTILTGKLKNDYNSNALFILMNPSHANKEESDKTVNYCAHIAFHDLKHLKIGSFTIVNVHPYYESQSTNLSLILDDLVSRHPKKHNKIMDHNRMVIKNTIRNTIENNGCVFICTGLVPKTISDKKQYREEIRLIYDELEKYKKPVFICKGDRNKEYIALSHLTYHISPQRSYIRHAKRYTLKKRKFIEIPKEKPLQLTHYLKKEG